MRMRRYNFLPVCGDETTDFRMRGDLEIFSGICEARITVSLTEDG